MKMDTVAYINGVRSAGFCKPWSYSLELLDTAFEDLKNENENENENENSGKHENERKNENEKSVGIFPVINTVITNLKYMEQDRSQRESGGAVVKAQDVFRWMLERNIPPSTLIMVRKYVYVLCITLCYSRPFTTHTYKHTYIHTHSHTSTHTHIHTHSHKHTHIHIHTYTSYTYT